MKNEDKYTKFALCREMMETPAILKNFKRDDTDTVVEQIKQAGRLFFTGEGSSRIFPAKNAMAQAMRDGLGIHLATDGSFQATEYNLEKFVVFGASNSGQTKEIICLIKKLKEQGHNKLFGLTAREGTKLASFVNQTFVLSCGWEEAVAATKSVAEQALFYQSLLAKAQGKCLCDRLAALGDSFEDAVSKDIDSEIIKAIAQAGTIFFAGRNDGVAEELTLKTNEITRKKSDFLEGTYLLHGVEEVMNTDDVVILVEPYKSELDLIKKLIADGVGCKVFAIATEDTIFPTIKVKSVDELTTYSYLAAGWNILVEVGLGLGIDLDKPERARKVGNVFTD
ncbi:MAG: SIS domain-containing protein [Planctomycetota bacterium]|jgi:glucosamine--fructose-6-phosphate aminotransferase (isomerizing)